MDPGIRATYVTVRNVLEVAAIIIAVVTVLQLAYGAKPNWGHAAFGEAICVAGVYLIRRTLQRDRGSDDA